jgi:hypothetical protein
MLCPLAYVLVIDRRKRKKKRVETPWRYPWILRVGNVKNRNGDIRKSYELDTTETSW